jgi:hypothetical protein
MKSEDANGGALVQEGAPVEHGRRGRRGGGGGLVAICKGGGGAIGGYMQ